MDNLPNSYVCKNIHQKSLNKYTEKWKEDDNLGTAIILFAREQIHVQMLEAFSVQSQQESCFLVGIVKFHRLFSASKPGCIYDNKGRGNVLWMGDFLLQVLGFSELCQMPLTQWFLLKLLDWLSPPKFSLRQKLWFPVQWCAHILIPNAHKRHCHIFPKDRKHNESGLPF